MPINQQYFVLSVVAIGFLAVALFKSIQSAYKTKDRMHVFPSVWCVLIMLMLFFFVIENLTLATIMLFFASIMSIVWWWKYPPKKWMHQPYVQQAVKKELEKKKWSSKESLKLSDFAGYRAWVKIASKYGMRTALFILYLFLLPIDIGVYLSLHVIGIPLGPSSVAFIVIPPIPPAYFMREMMRKFLEAEGIKEKKEEIYESLKEPKELYGMLLSAYTQFYGSRSKRVLDDKITALMKQGLSREVATRKLAEKEGLTKRA